MIAMIVTLAYLAVSLATMRYAYTRLRAYEIHENAHTGSSFDTEAQLFNGFCAVFIGALWPLGALILAITHNPPKSATELHQEAQKRENYIRELERELGLGDH